MDMAMAAQAAGEDMQLCHNLASSTRSENVEKDVAADYGGREGAWELPSVDDLEVAAAAAAAALESIQELQQAESESESDESDDSSSDDSEMSEDEDDDSDDEAAATPAAEAFTKAAKQHRTTPATSTDDSTVSTVKVNLSVNDGEGMEPCVSLALSVEEAAEQKASQSERARQATAAGESSQEEDSSSEDEEMEEEEEEEILDYAEMSAVIQKAYEQDDEQVEVGMAALVKELGLDKLPEVDAKLEEGDKLEVAGTVSSVMDGMIVVQGPANKPALLEGTTLFMEDRTTVGILEDVFGPVQSPWYLLRWAAKTPMPTTLTKEAILYSTPRLTSHVLPAEMYQNTAKAKVVDVEEGDDEEVFFSDDEAEAEYLKQKAAEPGAVRKAGSNDRRRKRDQNSGKAGSVAQNGKGAQGKGPAPKAQNRGTNGQTFGFNPGFLNSGSKGGDAQGGRRPRGNRKPQGGAEAAKTHMNGSRNATGMQNGGFKNFQQTSSSGGPLLAAPQGFNIFGPGGAAPAGVPNFAPNSAPNSATGPVFGAGYGAATGPSPRPNFSHSGPPFPGGPPQPNNFNGPPTVGAAGPVGREQPFTFGSQPADPGRQSWAPPHPPSTSSSFPSHPAGPAQSWHPGGAQNGVLPPQHPGQHSMPQQQPYPGAFNPGRPPYPVNHGPAPSGYGHGPPGHHGAGPQQMGGMGQPPQAFMPGPGPAGYPPQGNLQGAFMGPAPPAGPHGAPWPPQSWQ